MFSILRAFRFVPLASMLQQAISSLLGANVAPPAFRCDVDLVSVSFSVTDASGRYVHGLNATDIRIYEDGVEQQVATFHGPSARDSRAGSIESSVFVLMNASNSMYEEFAHAVDAVSAFLRSLEGDHAVALYTFNRNLYRAVPLGRDVSGRLSPLSPVLGDKTAVLNSLLMTIRDAAKTSGTKTVVLLSNGPDNASIVGPDDVARVAREEGIPVHIIFTTPKYDPLTTAFQRIAMTTAGQPYPAPTWQQQRAALERIRDDLLNSYTVSYYPKPNSNLGFRKIGIEITSDVGRHYRVRGRPGYKPSLPPPRVPCSNCGVAQLLHGPLQPVAGSSSKANSDGR